MATLRYSTAKRCVPPLFSRYMDFLECFVRLYYRDVLKRVKEGEILPAYVAFDYKDTIFVVPSTNDEKIWLEVTSEILCFIQNKTFTPDHVKIFNINDINDLDAWLMKNTFYFPCETKLNRDKNGKPRILNNIQVINKGPLQTAFSFSI